MGTNNQCLSKTEKSIIIFHMKINIFTAVKYCCILHRCVCVMHNIQVPSICAISVFTTTLRLIPLECTTKQTVKNYYMIQLVTLG